MEETVARFHNLGGNTIGEHKKNFNLYLKDLHIANPDVYFSSLVPKNRQEQIFRIKILQNHNRLSDLLTLFLAGDTITCKLIIKHQRFIRFLQKTHTGEEFTLKICPKLSFVIRSKTINKLAHQLEDEGTSFEYYTAVLSAYGLKAATPFLTGCSETVLLEALVEKELRFKLKQWIRIHQKHPNIFTLHLNKANKCPKLLRYLRVSDLNAYKTLIQEGEIRLGRADVKIVLRNFGCKFLTNRNYNYRTVYRELNREDYKNILRSKLPQTADRFSMGCTFYRYFKMLPVKSRGEVLFALFREKYGAELTDWVEKKECKSSVLSLLSVEDRMRFKLIDDCLAFLPINESIAAIKKKLEIADQNARAGWGLALLKTCKVNNDLHALLDVLKFFSTKHKNDAQQVRFTFVQYLTNNFPLENLGLEYWEHIGELVMRFVVNNEATVFLQNTVEKWILCKIRNNLDYTNELKLFCATSGAYKFQIFLNHPDYRRECLLNYTALIDEVYKNTFDVTTAHQTHVLEIVSFNLKHPGKMIPLRHYQESLEMMLSERENKDDHHLYLSKLILKSLHMDSTTGDDLFERIYKHFSLEFNEYHHIWFLSKRLPIVERNHEKLFGSNNFSKRVAYELSKVEYLELHRKLKAAAVKILKETPDTLRVCNALTFLAHTDTPAFLETIEKYLPPPDCKIDVHAENMRELLLTQKTILKSLNSIEKTLYFCNADYAQYALQPLYLILNNTPEECLEDPVRVLLAKTASARKHALHIALTLGSARLKRETLLDLIRNETNSGMKVFIYEKLLKYIGEERSEECFELLVSHINLVTDSERLSTLLQFHQIPAKYYTSYVELVWNHLLKQGKHEEFQVLTTMNYTKCKEGTFWDELVEHSFLNPNNERVFETGTFLANYLHYSTGETTQRRIEIIWKKISRVETSYSNIFNTFHVIVKRLIKEANEEVVSKLHSNLPSLKMEYNKFELELLMNLTKHYLGERTSFGKYLVILQSELSAEHSDKILCVYWEFLRRFLAMGVELSGKQIGDFYLELVELLLDADDSDAAKMLAMQLIVVGMPENASSFQRYKTVIGKMRNNKSPIVELHLMGFLRRYNFM